MDVSTLRSLMLDLVLGLSPICIVLLLKCDFFDNQLLKLGMIGDVVVDMIYDRSVRFKIWRKNL
jgi:hypothetical protein